MKSVWITYNGGKEQMKLLTTRKIDRIWRKIRVKVRRKYKDQSTFNPNIPLRGLFYFARLYEAYAKKQDIEVYGRKLMKLPAPQFIVFYNGKEDMPDEMELKLSDAFIPSVEEKDVVLECKARMLNINYGHNQQILNTCRSEVFHMILTEYDEKKHLRNIREEGREEGIEKINTLNCLLIEANRMDDVARAAKDKQFQEQLFKEFGL